MFQSDYDISFLASGVDVAVSLGDLLERIAPINDRFEFSCLGQPREKMQIFNEAVEKLFSSPHFAVNQME